MYSVDLSKPLNSSLPLQSIPLKDKLKDRDDFGVSKWMKDTMDAGEALGRYSLIQNASILENYKLVSKEFDIAHYMETQDRYDLVSAIAREFEIPYHLKHYDITGKAVNLLVGEYSKRPDVFSVRCYNEEATNERLRVKTDLLKSYLNQEIQREITAKLEAQGVDTQKKDFKDEEEAQKYKQDLEAKYQELTPPAIEKYMRYDYRTSAESWGQAVLSNDRIRFNFREQEKIEFTDMLIADRCFSHFYTTPTGYEVETWNPRNVFFDHAPEIRKVEEGDYVGRTIFISKARLIDRYGWRMTEKQIKTLYPEINDPSARGGVYGEAFNATMYPFPAYRDFNNVTTAIGYDGFNNNPTGFAGLSSLSKEEAGFGNPLSFPTGDIVQLTEFYWRSQTRIGYLTLIDPQTETPITQIVTEEFNPKLFDVKEIKDSSLIDMRNNFEPNTIIWTWKTEFWQGCKASTNIHNNTIADTDRTGIYFDIKPCPFQFKGDFSPFLPKAPVCGGIFNNRNAKSNSLVDLMKPYQIAYNAFMNAAYGTAQKNNGKMMLLDVRMLSSFKDWGGEQAVEKAMTIGRELGILPIDTSPTNMLGSQFNQMSVHDFDESEKVERLMRLAVVWEDQGLKQIGISPQRQGTVQASESATGVQAAVNNSYAVTEPYFENFYNYKKRKLTMLLDMAQYTASTKEGDITLSYTTSDMGNAFINVTNTEVMLANMGVYIDNAQETLQDLQNIKAIAQQNTTGLPPSALIKMTTLKTVASITKAVEEAEAKQQQQVQQQQAHEKEMQDAQIKSQQEAQDKLIQNDNMNKQLDRENKLSVASLSSLGFDTDTQDNGMLDVIEQSKIDIDKSRLEHDRFLGTQASLNQSIDSTRKYQLETQKLALQEKNIKAKEKALTEKTNSERIKNQGIREQNVSQEKISSEKHRADMSLLNKEAQVKEKESANDIKISKIKLDIAKVQLKNVKKPKLKK